MRSWSRSVGARPRLGSAVLATVGLALLLPAVGRGDEECATSPFDPPPAGGSSPNTYFPGAGTVTLAPGTISIPVGTPTPGAPIAAGDLLLVIQMQDADINTDNDGNYGDGEPVGTVPPPHDPGRGVLSANQAGRYEYVVATGAVVPGTPATVPIRGTGPDLGGGPGLNFTYRNEAFVDGESGHGQRRYQVIRVPRYADLTVPPGGLRARPWDGSAGGLLALDVRDVLDLNGQTLDASGRGFRGGYGDRVLGGTGLPTSDADYRNTSAADLHGVKGEGIAGTPRFLHDPAVSSPFLVDTGVEGYPRGSRGRGAPGNAGGGGNSEDANGEGNSGGGGGGNGGAGGSGGFSKSGLTIGGFGGAAFTDGTGAPLWSAARVIMGGGGGAGGRHDANTQDAHGGAGGGIVLIRTGSVAPNPGTIRADGASVSSASNEAGGGGGAGGSIVLVARSGTWSSATVSARGGDGSDAGAGTSLQGPGGGGGGGVILANAAVGSADTSGGDPGLTDKGTDPYGAAAGPGGTGAPGTGGNPFIDAGDIPGSTSGSDCSQNAPPVAADDAYSVSAGATLNVPAPGVLGNDTDAEGAALTAALVAGPAAGALTLDPDGSFSFDSTGVGTPTVTFTYTASDGSASSLTAVVTITIGNAPPAASDDSGSTAEDATLVVGAPGVLGNDTDANGDPLTAQLVAGPANGTLTLGADGSYTYVPDADFHGTDSFTYLADDGQASSVAATVAITVTPVNDLPSAADDVFNGVQNSVLVSSVGVLANDTDADGESLSAVLVAGPSNGTLTLNADGSFTYTPAFAFVGTDVFTYQASDGTGASNVAAVSVVVAAGPPFGSRKAGYCSAAVGELGTGAFLLGAALLGLLFLRGRASKGVAALLLVGSAAAAAQAQDASVPRRLVLEQEERPEERPVLQEPTAPGPDLVDVGRLGASLRAGVVAFGDDFESDPQASGGLLLRAPSPWVSQVLLGLESDDVGFYLDLTVSRIDRDLDFLDEDDGTLVFVGLGTDVTLVRDDTWLALGQAGLQYGWFGKVDDTDDGVAITLGLLGGVQVASSFWITVNPQIAFADAGDQLYFLHVGAHLAF